MMYVLWLLRVRVARRPADLVMLVSLFIAALLPCVRACAAVHKVGEGLRVGPALKVLGSAHERDRRAAPRFLG